ncbi:hypothetical protein AGR1C_Cc70076 [Agrobacterium fabacearum TT111]|nr:hypothetical protein AGR1C_Cc70076 [Agrobacterium fabacearum TT111]
MLRPNGRSFSMLRSPDANAGRQLAL